LTARFLSMDAAYEAHSKPKSPHCASYGATGFFQEKLRALQSTRLSPPAIDLLSGITAGFLTGLLTNPMDVVTARLMTQKADIAKGLLPGFRASVGAPYKGFGDCVLRMAREEGPRSFLIGVKSRVGWIAPFTAISLGLNNVLRRRVEAYQALQAKQDEP
jgi:Mitochondrial carrier protein